MFPFNRQFKIQMKSAFRFEKKRYQVTRWIIHQRLVDIQIPRFGRWPISIIYIKRDTQVTRVTPLLSLVSINNVFQWKWISCTVSIASSRYAYFIRDDIPSSFRSRKRNLRCFWCRDLTRLDGPPLLLAHRSHNRTCELFFDLPRSKETRREEMIQSKGITRHEKKKENKGKRKMMNCKCRTNKWYRFLSISMKY